MQMAYNIYYIEVYKNLIYIYGYILQNDYHNKNIHHHTVTIFFLVTENFDDLL